jgi:hypothetical protein
MWVILAAFWYVPAISDGFWRFVGLTSQFIGIPIQLAGLGLSQFRFWQ